MCIVLTQKIAYMSSTATSSPRMFQGVLNTWDVLGQSLVYSLLLGLWESLGGPRIIQGWYMEYWRHPGMILGKEALESLNIDEAHEPLSQKHIKILRSLWTCSQIYSILLISDSPG